MTGSTATPQSASSTSGLRERKKRRTRDALARAAMELFTTKGFERTTVDEIAEAVEVSQRTFFRYFANKEQAAFAVEELLEEHLVAAVRSHPSDAAPLEVLRRSVLDTWDDLNAADREAIPLELQMRMYRLVESTPALLAVRLRRQAELERRIAEEVARREGLDPRTDLRPRVLVAAFTGVVRAASERWGCRYDSGMDAEVAVGEMRQILERHLDALGPALTDSWGTTGA